MKESDEVDVLYIDDEPADVQLPSAIELEVAETEPGVCAATPHPVEEPSRRCSRPARASRSRCSSTSETSCGWTPAPANTCLVPGPLLSTLRRTEQRRAAIWALYQSDLLGRPLELGFPGHSRVHPGGRAAGPRPPAGARRADLAGTPPAGRWSGSLRSSVRSSGSAWPRCSTRPSSRASRPSPRRARSTRRSRPPSASAAPRPGIHQRDPRARAAGAQ